MQATPQPRHDRSTQDIGNLVEFGHINLRVPDQLLAIAFYVSGLGLTRDPYLVTGVENAWVNVGRSQFHLPVGPAQHLGGTVHLVIDDLAALVQRLEAVRSTLAGTQFGFVKAGEHHLDVRCPWGNRIRVHAPDPVRFGPMRLGMPCVEVDVPRGTVSAIARFYRIVLGSPAEVGSDDDGPFVRIPVGIGESLVLRETAGAIVAGDGPHVQVTVADFSGVHRRLLERGLITEESNASQYRFERIVDPDDGTPLATLEHEVRSMRHPLYGRALVNRDPSIGTRRYAVGYEAVSAWMLPP